MKKKPQDFNINLIIILISTLLGVSGCGSTGNYKYFQISFSGEPSLAMKHTASIFTARVTERSGAREVERNDRALKIVLEINQDIGTEGFRIEDVDGGVKIIGNDDRGMLYGVGKFLHTCNYSKDGITAGKWRGISVPEKTVRGIYFATHYYNFYQTAPIQEIETYLEDLALWGTNNVMFWYDMHHFRDEKDPEGIAFLDRLRQIANAAHKVGMGVSFTMTANEGYGESPGELRAKSGAARGGVYLSDICPGIKGGMEYIEKIRANFFDRIKDLQPEFITIWPYDQGGCGCKICMPWGSNGFIKTSGRLSALARQMLPGVKIILSTWMFDANEWKSLNEEFAKGINWVDLILEEPLESYKVDYTTFDGNLPVIRFPEISMYNTFPWGGFGATPIPLQIKRTLSNITGKEITGGFPYSEGIFEDINKVVCEQLFWDSRQPPDNILKEYASYEFSQEYADSLVKVIHILEQNHHWRWWPDMLSDVKLSLDWFPCKGAKVQEDPGAEQAYSIVKIVDNNLSATVKTSWRWRLLFIRTMLDARLKANGGLPDQDCDEGFRELAKIYHASSKTDPCVRPPVKGAGY
jgi:hypothetical protein